MGFEHEVVVVSNYSTDALPRILSQKGKEGYELVSVVMAKDTFTTTSMYLFFKRRKKEK